MVACYRFPAACDPDEAETEHLWPMNCGGEEPEERRLSNLVNAAYGLTPEEIALIWGHCPTSHAHPGAARAGRRNDDRVLNGART